MTKHIFIETVKVKDGVFVNRRPHEERILRTTLHFFHEPLAVKLSDEMIPINLSTGIVKCRIVYSMEVISIDFESYKIRNIQSLALVEDNLIDYNFKYYNRETINRLMTQRNDCDDILIVKNSFITDTSYSNVVFKNFDGQLFTPLSPLLHGTKRQKLLNKGVILEKKIHINDIKSFLGVYIINALVDIEDNLFVGSVNIRR